MAISVSVDSTTSLVDGFYVPKMVLNTQKHVIEYQKVKKKFDLSYLPIYDFAKLCHWRFSFLAITQKVKGLLL